jgi:signal peptidase II
MNEVAAVPSPRAHVRLTAIIIAVGLALDQITKLWVLHGTRLPGGEWINVLPVLDFVLSWNRGISYGLFQQEEGLGRWLLVAFTVVATIALTIWMLRSHARIAAIGLALIVSGAIGNLIDRVIYGAVVDFIYFHVGGFSWYVFNLADTWIVAGVALLLYDSFRPSHNDAAKSG